MNDPLLAALASAGALSPADAARALDRQQEAGGALDTALLEMGLVDDDTLAPALARAAGLPLAPPSAFAAPDPRGRRVFPAKVAERHGIAPFAMEGRELSVVTAYPPDVGLLDEISFMLSLHLRPHVAPEWRVRSLVQQLYGAPVPDRLAALAAPAAAGSGEVELGQFAPVEAAGDAAPQPPADAAPAPARPAPAEPPGEPAADPTPAMPRAGHPRRDDGFSVPPPRPAPSSPATPSAPRASAAEAAERWTAEQARQALAGARDRDAVIAAALRYVQGFFEYAAVLVVGRERIVGHDARGAGEAGRAACRAVSVPLAEPGLFRTPVDTRAPYLGPPATDAGSLAVLAGLGRRDPRTVLVHPVFVRDRPVCLVYADNGDAPVSAGRLGDLFVFLGNVGHALEQVILKRKTRTLPAVAAGPAIAGPPGSAVVEPQAVPDAEPWSVQEPARVPAPRGVEDRSLPVDAEMGGYEVATAAEALAPERLLDLPAAVADLAASAPGSDRRASLVEALSRRGPEAAEALVEMLPGPQEAIPGAGARPPVEAQGPIPAALAALGPSARRSLTVTLSAADVTSRRLAVQLLGRLGEAAPLDRITARVFDEEPEVAAAACDALADLTWHPAMPATVEALRAELGAPGPRAIQAARALAAAGDGGAVPLLISLLDRGGDTAAAAEEALSRIALRRLGSDKRRWGAWWSAQRGVSRIQWALEALTGPDRELRQVASEDLRRVAPPPVPYHPDAPAHERERAARAWGALWQRPGGAGEPAARR